MLFGLVSNALQQNMRQEAGREDDVQSCLNQIRSLEHRVSSLEQDRNSAA